ncbi:putative Peptidase M23 [Nitrospina gracilis 3/211]|uniref:Putative Peptidase M23 n=1 Tax=Nitrospina gracilis (strain 3/211) TaxID=1266370 RepID=M1YLY2_NITG3|nr:MULTISPECIES: peptidoglycan DD-metalloendopeptidase family protein [Nitrospina]MCF8724344.1 septal ring factor EnvC (AmiA/AmiB activator) [Nitrospina sp. Nb-3]CCQ91495.1 putative Peptidase M23 [Nitrospina gracilis 3/211]
MTVLVSGMAGPAFSKEKASSQVEHLLEQEKGELEALRKKIEKQDRELSRIGKEETRILKTLRHLEDRKKLRERELQIYQYNIHVNEKRVGEAKEAIARHKKRLGQYKLVLRDRLRQIYKNGDMYLVKILFSSVTFNQLLTRLKYMENVMAYDAVIFQDYMEQMEKLQAETEKLEKSQISLVRYEEEALEKKRQLEEEAAYKSQFLKNVKTKKIYAMQTRKELIKASEGLNQLIGRLEEKLILKQGLSLEDMKGRLQYPVKGKRLNRFGKKWDDRFDTYIVYNGVNLGVKAGTSVKAIFYGKVLYTGFLEGYGNLVILGHGNSYHSLYGHLNSIQVKKGEVVEEGKVIGLSGNTGSLVGDALYFELRHKGKPIKPSPWFQVAGK